MATFRNTRAAFALSSLNNALQGAKARQAAGINRSRPLPDMSSQTAASLDKVRKAEVSHMVASPARIAAAVYPWKAPAWPVEDRTAADVLTDCRAYLEAARKLSTPWARDINRVVALEQAEAALVTMQEVA